MLKIGIITHYFNSTNYGGNLQAYALCKYLNGLGFNAVQISYDRTSDTPTSDSLIKKIKAFLRQSQKSIKTLPTTIKSKRINDNLNQRKKAVLEFNKSIPHTEVYDSSTIFSANNHFDVFITGSDQVWNPSAVCSAYLLDFVDCKNAFKMSYAASISANKLDDYVIKKYQNSLKDYFAVSVRENQAIKLLEPYVEQEIHLVLDPTLLLPFEDWNAIKKSPDINDRYLFCYFLGDSAEQRKLAEEFAQKRNLKIVTIPYLSGSFRKCDKNFGDIKISDVSPEKFIGLIADSEYVFTDSFHATVFSVFFKKQFFVFDRIIKQSLGSRIKNLTELFEMEERFCDTAEKISLDYINSVNPIDYSKRFCKYESEKINSEMFLSYNLRKIKEMIEK